MPVRRVSSHGLAQRCCIRSRRMPALGSTLQGAASSSDDGDGPLLPPKATGSFNERCTPALCRWRVVALPNVSRPICDRKERLDVRGRWRVFSVARPPIEINDTKLSSLPGTAIRKALLRFLRGHFRASVFSSRG